MILDEAIKQIKSFLRTYNDDPIDRFHNRFSVVGLAIYLVLLTSKQFYGEPIQCTIGSSVDGDLSKYIHSMCWINGTFSVIQDGDTLLDFKNQKRIIYYQWITFIIIFLIALFRIPPLIWNFMIYLNGFDLSYISKSIMKKVYLDEYEEKSNWLKTQTKVDSINDHLKMTFLKQKTYFSKRFKLSPKLNFYKKLDDGTKTIAGYRKAFPNLKKKSTFPLLVPYIFIKCLYLANIVFNFFILTELLNFNYFKFGFDVFSLYSRDGYNFLNQYFPKRAICITQFFVLHIQNEYTSVCSLPINLFNEFFFVGYWFWLVTLALLTLCSIFCWILLVIRPYRRHLVLNALQLSPNQNINGSYTAAFYFGEEATHDLADSFLKDKTGLSLMENFELFFNDVCSIDVVFAIKLISLNSNSLAFRDLLNNLWEHYLDLEELKIKDVNQRPVLQIRRPTIIKEIHDENEEAVSEA